MDERCYVLRSDLEKMFYGITATFESLFETFHPDAYKASKEQRSSRELIDSILNKKDKNQYDNQQNWVVNWDMRKHSQVVSYKPKFMVRKIIR